MIFDKAFYPRAPTTKAAADGAATQLTFNQLRSALGLEDTEPSMLSEATYYACLKVLSEAVGKLPLKLNRTEPGKGTLPQPGHPLYDVLRNRPNPFSTATAFWSSMETQRNHNGNACAYIQPYENTVRLWMLPWDQLQLWWDNKRLLSQTPRLWYIYRPKNGKRYAYSDSEVLHFRTWLSLDGVTGLSIREILQLTLKGNLSSQQMLNQLYKNGMTGKAVLQYTGDLNGELEQTFVRNLENYVDGKVDGSKSLIPLPMGTSLVPLNVKLADSQFVELKRHSALQVAAAFGVKPDQINDYTKSSYSSSEAQQLAFLVDTLLWILEHYEQEISYKLLSSRERSLGYGAKFSSGAMLRTTTDKQVESLAKGVANSIYTPDEARNHLDMCSQPGGNRLYAGNGSVIPLEMAGEQYRKGGLNADQ